MDHKEADTLHYIVSKLIWVAKMGRPGIEPDILFLCNRVTKSTVEYKENVKRVLQFLKHKINNKRFVGAENLSQLFIWVDAAYGVHPDLKNPHRWRYIILIRASVIQVHKKLNTKISAEAKVVILSY